MQNKALIKTLEYAKEQIHAQKNEHEMLIYALETINAIIELAKENN